MKKMLATILALSMAASLFVGGTVVQASDDVTLQMWVWDDAQVPPTQAMIDEFHEANPNINVEITSIAGVDDFNTKVRSVIGTTDAPDVFWINFNLAAEYIPMGFVQDLTDYMEADDSFDITKLNAGITDAYTVDGRIYGIAKDVDSFGVYYNKSLFDAAGVAYPEDDWTVDDFVETAKALTTDTVKGYSGVASNADRVASVWMYAFGGSPYTEDGQAANVNSEESVAAMQTLLDLINGGYAFNGTELAELDALTSFQSGLCAMMIDGSWNVSTAYAALGENLGIAELPEGPGGRGSTGHGIAYATTTSGQHPEETWKFLSYLGSDSAQEKQVEVVIPAANEAASTWESVYPDLNLAAFVRALGYTKPYLADVNPTAARSAYQEYLGNMISGVYETAQEAMDAAAEAMNDAIDQ